MTSRPPAVVARMRILAVVGSLNPGSSNAALAEAAAAIAPAGVDVVGSQSIGALPHFDPSLPEPPAVATWRAEVAGADGVLIAAPEYAHSLPGSLENALDWLVGTGELYGTPVAVLTATPRPGAGALGRAALEQTLRAQGAEVRSSASVVVRKDGEVDDDGRALVLAALDALRAAAATPVAAT